MGVARTVAYGLERGLARGPFARLAARGWSAAMARVAVRPLSVDARVCVVTVGGATLGGSGKTPLALACALELARGGARVALIGHGYGGRPRRARVVGAFDPCALVGDEALALARAVAPRTDDVTVVVAPHRQHALDFAGARADALVIDGVAQLGPRPADLALLAVEADEPWGAGRCPPCGDLRAPVRALVAACDLIVPVADADGPIHRSLIGLGKPIAAAHVESRGATLDARPLPWSVLATMRLGLITLLARPDRVVRALERRGIAPLAVVSEADHGPLTAAALRRAGAATRAHRLDVWLATSKCALHLPAHIEAVHIAVIEHALVASPTLADALARALTLRRGV